MTDQPKSDDSARKDSTSIGPVVVQVATLDQQGRRQIGPLSRVLQELTDYKENISAAISQVAGILTDSHSKMSGDARIALESLEAKFSLTLAGKGTVVIVEASAEATIEVTLSMKLAN